jgi:hypothetical protein
MDMSIDDRLKKLGVSRKTIAEIPNGLDLGQIITQDEFNKNENKLPPEERSKGYRMRAIERMIRDDIMFTTNTNIIQEMFEHFIGAPACPRDECTHLMKFDSSGGGAAGISITYKCEDCGAEIEIEIPNEGITYRPPPKKTRRK